MNFAFTCLVLEILPSQLYIFTKRCATYDSDMADRLLMIRCSVFLLYMFLCVCAFMSESCQQIQNGKNDKKMSVIRLIIDCNSQASFLLTNSSCKITYCACARVFNMFNNHSWVFYNYLYCHFNYLYT